MKVEYPVLTKEWIRIFYGGFQKVDGRSSEMTPEMVKQSLRLDSIDTWKKLKAIDLKEFYQRTRPQQSLKIVAF